MEPEIFDYLMNRYDVRRFKWCGIRERKTNRLLPGRANHPYESYDEFTNECMFVVKYPYDSVAIDVQGIDDLRATLLLMDRRWQLDPDNESRTCCDSEQDVCDILAQIANDQEGEIVVTMVFSEDREVMKTLYIAVVNDVEVYQSFDQEEFNRNLILYGDQATTITREVEEEPVAIELNLLAPAESAVDSPAESAVEVLEADVISLNNNN